MKYINLKVVSVLMILFSLCTSCQDYYMNNLDYQRELSKFDTKLTNHFPDKLPKNFDFTFLKDEEDSLDVCFWPNYLLLQSKVTPDEYQNLKSKVEKINLKVYNGNSEDMILLVKYCDYTKEDDNFLFLSKVVEKNKSCEDCYPVLSFYELVFYGAVEEQPPNKTYYGMNYDFNMYILGAEQGVFIEEKYLTDEFYPLPEEWHHGYSKGIIMNDNTFEVYYWVAVW